MLIEVLKNILAMIVFVASTSLLLSASLQFIDGAIDGWQATAVSVALLGGFCYYLWRVIKSVELP